MKKNTKVHIKVYYAFVNKDDEIIGNKFYDNPLDLTSAFDNGELKDSKPSVFAEDLIVGLVNGNVKWQKFVLTKA